LWSRRKASLAQRETTITKELGELEAEREAKSKEIPGEIYDKYQRLRRTKGASAIVGVQTAIARAAT